MKSFRKITISGLVGLLMLFSQVLARPVPAESETRYFAALHEICNAGDAVRKRDFEGSKLHCLRAFALIDTLQPSIALGELHNMMGNTLVQLEEYEAGFQHYLAAEAALARACPEGCHQSATNQTLVGMYYYFVKPNVRQARDHLEKALQLWLKVPHEDTLAMTSTMLYLGNTSRELGEFSRATELHTQALLIRQRVFGENSPEAIGSLLSLGNTQFEVEDYAAAQASFVRAIDAAALSPGTSKNRVYDLKNNLAVTLVELGEYDAALKNYQEVRAYYSQQANRSARKVGLAMQNTALVLMRMKRFEEARAQFYALEQFLTQEAQEPGYCAQIEQDFAYFFSQIGELDSALAHIQHAIHLLAPAVPSDQITALPSPREAEGILELKDHLMMKGEFLRDAYKAGKGDTAYLSLALDCFDLSIGLLDEVWLEIEDPGDKLSVNQNGVSMYEQALDISATLWEQTRDPRYLNRILAYMERGKSQLMLESIRRARAAFLTGIPDSLHLQNMALRAQISDLNHQLERHGQNPDSVAVLHKKLLDARSALTDLANHISKDFPAYSQMVGQRAPIDLAVLQQRFSGKNELLLEYYLSDSNLYVLSLWAGKAHFRKHQLGPEFDQRYDAFLATMRGARKSTENHRAYERDGFFLYNVLMGPELARGAEDIQRIRIVPDGKLAAFPFDALPVSASLEAGAFHELDLAIHHYLISYAGSATLLQGLQKMPRMQAPAECLGFAWAKAEGNDNSNRLFRPGQPWPDIPGTAEELTAIQNKVFGKYLMGEQATEQAFKKYAARYGVIHLALHGSAAEDEPILAFPEPGEGEDGILYLEELYSLPLAARLTVLSACETGLGNVQKGEGVMSMARGFGIAGCPSVVMSLWEVDDRSSSLIMESFYQGLAQGMEIDMALREAKLAYLESSESQSTAPFYWASFIPVGQTDPVLLHRKDAATWPYALGFGSIALFFAAAFIIRNRVSYKSMQSS